MRLHVPPENLALTIKEWFADYYLYNCDVTLDFANNNDMIIHNNVTEPWKVTLVDTGLDTMTGGRIKRIEKYVGNNRFMLTYGDAVSNIDIKSLLRFHEHHRRLATVTAISINERFGVLDLDESNTIRSFREKSEIDSGRISGGFMVLEPGVFSYLRDDSTIFEKETMPRLAIESQIKAYKHNGFWQCMDTKREHDKLEDLWKSGNAPWKTWD